MMREDFHKDLIDLLNKHKKTLDININLYVKNGKLHSVTDFCCNDAVVPKDSNKLSLVKPTEED